LADWGICRDTPYRDKSCQRFLKKPWDARNPYKPYDRVRMFPHDADLRLKHKEGCCKHVADDIAPMPPGLPEQMDLGAEDINIGVGESESAYRIPW
jgi:hypothetical protein